jgi:signal peptidase
MTTPHVHPHPHAHLPHVEAHAHGKHHRRRDVLDVVLFLLTLAFVAYLWPASLGGRTHFVVVQGHSMEPTFHYGDVVVARDNDAPKVGQIIVYEVPKDSPAAGMLIIHRIKSVWPDGTFQTQGDNRTTPDPFHITRDDVVGTPVRAIPHVGRLIGLSSHPLVVAVAAGALTMFVLWPSKPRHRGRRSEKVGDDPDDDALSDHVDPAVERSAKVEAILARLDEENLRVRARSLSEKPADDVEREAQRWLDEQLASLTFD